MQKIVTIITICLNEEKVIENTINSVLMQDFEEFEYIIKDGQSSDSTNEIIEKYTYKFNQKKIPFFHYVEKDNGIYDAMNWAVKKAKGKWVIFMNAGDSFYNSNVLNDIFKYKRYNSADILYGHTVYKMSGGYKIVVCNKHENLVKGDGICQQSCFIRRNLFEKKQFDTNFNILADYDFLLSLMQEKKKFININIIVSIFNHEGISSRSVEKCEKEFIKAFEKNELIPPRRKTKLRIFVSEIFTNVCPTLSDLLVCYKLCKRGI